MHSRGWPLLGHAADDGLPQAATNLLCLRTPSPPSPPRAVDTSVRRGRAAAGWETSYPHAAGICAAGTSCRHEVRRNGADAAMSRPRVFRRALAGNHHHTRFFDRHVHLCVRSECGGPGPGQEKYTSCRARYWTPGPVCLGLLSAPDWHAAACDAKRASPLGPSRPLLTKSNTQPGRPSSYFGVSTPAGIGAIFGKLRPDLICNVPSCSSAPGTDADCTVVVWQL